MTPRDDIRDLLPLYVLGLLEPVEAGVVERAVRADPALAAELASYDAAAAKLIDTLPPVVPPTAVRERLLASLSVGRFERFTPRFTELYDVAIERARELLAMIEDPGSHQMTAPGVHLIHFAGGPASAGADCGFVIMKPGAEFPWHRHDGDERGLVMQGTMLDCDGTVLRPGDEDHHEAGTEHSFTAGDGDDLIFCARVWGLRFDVERPKSG